MIFDWLRRRRRERILEEPFPEAWREILGRNLACFGELDEAEQTHLCQLVQVFVAEKHWEGLGGLEMSDEIRVTVAGQACVLILGLDHDLYQQVESILVYPSTVIAPAPREGFGVVLTAPPGGPMPVLGQAFSRGPLILAWDAVRRGGRNAHDGHNVVMHELAHKLDMLGGSADGVPPFGGRRDLCAVGGGLPAPLGRAACAAGPRAEDVPGCVRGREPGGVLRGGDRAVLRAGAHDAAEAPGAVRGAAGVLSAGSGGAAA
jgi:Mlc titration factor MtfA (ptsG expression regulator)